MSDTVELENAAAEARAARERLLATTNELQARLAPATLIGEARAGLAHAANEIAETAGETARRRPGAAVGIAALAALALFNRPARRLVRRLFRRDETSKPKRR